MKLDETMAIAVSNNLLRCGRLLLRREAWTDERAVEGIAATVAESLRVLEASLNRVVLAPPQGPPAGTYGSGHGVRRIDDEVA